MDDAQTRDRVLRALGLVDRHLAGLHDQMTHGRGGAIHALDEALKKLIPDGQPDDSLHLDPDDDNGRYFDWSTRQKNGMYGWEIGGGDNEDSAVFDLHPEDMRQLAGALSVTLMRNRAAAPDPSDPNSLLISSLLHVGQRNGITFGEDNDVDTTGRYFDWSIREDNGSYRLEAGSDDGAVLVEMSPDELSQLHAQLTRTLLREDRPTGGERAKDVTPGHDELHHYWTRDPPRA